MKVFLRAAALCVAIICGSAGQTANWVTVATTSQNEEIKVDAETMVIVGSTRTVWQSKFLRVPEKDGSVEYRYRMEYFCDRKTSKTLYGVTYDNKGATTWSHNFTTDYRSEEPIVPDSVGEAILKIVCSVTAGS